MPNRIVLRQKPRISYYEPEEPGLDEYIFCDSCGDFVFEYCSIHGPLLVVPDDKVNRNGMPAIVPRAALTIPKVFLHLAPSIIPGAGLGVFATLTLPRGVRFGPYRGKRAAAAHSNYCWQIYSKEHKPTHVIDAADSNSSNWMRYVNCARHWREQNLIAYQYRGELYYRTIKIIPRFTELMVYYGSIFARELQIDIARYNSPAGYAQKYGAPPIKKRKTNETKPQLAPETSEQTAANSETISLNTPPSQPETGKNKTKIKPTFGKQKCGKKEPPKLDKILKTNKIQKNSKKAAKNIVTNSSQQSSLETDVPQKKETNKIVNTPINTSTSSLLSTNNNIKNIDLDIYFKECNLKCINKEDLSKHMRFHDNSRPHVCDVCGYRFSYTSNLIRHKALIHKIGTTKEYFCDMCNYKCVNKGHLTNHIRTHTGDKPYSCNICSYKCTYKTNLTRHMRTHTGDKPYSCKICSYKCIQKTDLTTHMRTHTGDKPYSCKICSYKCTQKTNLTTHMRTHTGDKPYSCNICSYKCTDKTNLTRHMRTHTGDKPYSCKICSYKCIQKTDLTTHMRTHTGDKPYSCKICSYKCTQKTNLTTHMRTHTGDKPYSCNICSYKCTDKTNLTTHMRTHTGDKPYSCKICSYKCTQKTNLTTHMRTHTGDKPYSCDICDYKCAQSNSLKHHIITKHLYKKQK